MEAANKYWQDTASIERKIAFDKNLLQFSDQRLMAMSPTERFIKDYIRKGPKMWYDFTFDATWLWDNITINPVMFDHVWGTVFQHIDISKNLDTFDKPVFLGLGQYDFVVAPPVSWEPIQSKFNNLTTHIFEKSGHTPQYEEPKQFDEQLLQWLFQVD